MNHAAPMFSMLETESCGQVGNFNKINVEMNVKAKRWAQYLFYLFLSFLILTLNLSHTLDSI